MRKILPILILFGLLLLPQPNQAVAQATCPAVVIVQIGDTLGEIAARCAVSYASVRAANPAITNPDRIYPGQLINIPQGPGIPTTGGSTYVVQPGDRLFRIALRYNTTVAALQALNPSITNVNLIYPGQVILLSPGTGPGIPTTGGSIYVVQPGDTLFRIAQRYNTTVAVLQARNPWIVNVNYIVTGWQISVP